MAKTYVKHKSLLAKLGLLVVKWNQFETLTQTVLEALIGGGEKTYILTAHMGNVSLCDAIRTMGNEFAPDEAKTHLTHLLDLFERLREYRNYYVHGISDLTEASDGLPIGVAQSLSAKARLVLHQGRVDEADLDAMVKRLREANQYVTHVIILLWEMNDKALLKALGASFLRKPPLPDLLRRNRLHQSADR